MYSETTEFLRITVNPSFVESLSSVSEYYYIWSYNIILENLGDDTLQLLNRSWQIIDKNGQVQKVEGPGVVGQKPIIGSGQSFEYSSHTQLTTSSGIMFGSYEMLRTSDGSKFIAKIPMFSLDIPNEPNIMH